MKILARLLAVSALVLFVGLVFVPFIGTAAPEASTEPTLKPEDVRKIREAVGALSQIFGGEEAPSDAGHGQPASSPAPKPEKNMADVADRALSILSGYIGSAVAVVEKAAPEVWRVMIRQQYANAISLLVGPTSLLLVVILYVVILKKVWKKTADRDYFNEKGEPNERAARASITTLLPLILGLIVAVVFVWRLSNSIAFLINPEYYAFRNLLQLLLNRGSL